MSRLLPLFITFGVKADQTVQFYFESQLLNWNDARDFCRNAGRDLAAPRTAEEAARLAQERPADFGTDNYWPGQASFYWIGFRTSADDATWRDSNGQVPPLQPGVEGQPGADAFNPMRNNDPTDHCAHGYNPVDLAVWSQTRSPALWGDYDCAATNVFVCEERPNEVQFFPYEDAATFDEAVQRCEDRGMALALPQTAAELSRFKTVVESAPTTFGMGYWNPNDGAQGYWYGARMQGDDWVLVNGDPLENSAMWHISVNDQNHAEAANGLCGAGAVTHTVHNFLGDWFCARQMHYVCEARPAFRTLDVGVCEGQSAWSEWAPTSQAAGSFTMHSLCASSVGAQGRRIFPIQSGLPETDQTLNLQLDQLSCDDAEQDGGSCQPHEARFCCENVPVPRCPSGCWEEDANGDCVLADSCQVSVTCSTAGMNIQFPSDFFGADFTFQDTADCQPALDGANYAYQKPLGQCGSTVTREADENNVDFIVFRKNVDALVQDPVQSTRMIGADGNVLPIFRDVTSTLFSVSFSCTFPTSMQISAASVAVSGTPAPPTPDQTCPPTHPHSSGDSCCSVDPGENADCPPENSQACTTPPCVDNNDVVVTVASTQAPPANWDGSFDLKFYTDDTFATERSSSACPANFPHASADGATCCSTAAADCQGALSFPCPNAPCTAFDASNGGIFVGEELFVRAQWTVAGLADSLRYYVSDCDVEDTVTSQSLPIVKSSCYAGAIGAEALGAAATTSKVVTTSSAFKFTAFTFDATTQANTQDLSCTMKFCIWDSSSSTSDCDDVVDVGGNGSCPNDRGYQYRP